MVSQHPSNWWLGLVFQSGFPFALTKSQGIKFKPSHQLGSFEQLSTLGWFQGEAKRKPHILRVPPKEDTPNWSDMSKQQPIANNWYPGRKSGICSYRVNSIRMYAYIYIHICVYIYIYIHAYCTLLHGSFSKLGSFGIILERRFKGHRALPNILRKHPLIYIQYMYIYIYIYYIYIYNPFFDLVAVCTLDTSSSRAA